ncbi:hypothetical protein Emtol_3214 [Emticicia oligotrophica DSM 17448]|uniref:Secretion system C-terminal sorting domain-containing protein n=1 Tax=Emticicia oligotrophica (strain DSM 17448 / CIP 109782 / MTCC 6937 / GPTSA100-15) TaxID=929562 RepID=A0ABM5N4J1_EMTOG|nr:T9SS type A sorting domain-containing protein [Emticicia oligotrophica]AFK04343.1 hypothetical protein Emtol_3214 [Emticicia oligotrophica DSM 17448]
MKIFQNNRPVSICRSVILLVLFCTQLTYAQSLTLPFFDDFSLNKTSSPNPQLWINGGVSINNSFPINQPSVNVATFDSRNAAGIPYNFSNKFAYGNTDTLSSRPINLAGLAISDSVYLSFYWEAKGLGELPDEDDSLVVSLLNDKNQWKVVWRQQGTSKDKFTQALLPINKTEFLHQNFQFRFQTRGRQSGAFDMWHIDFVYLNKNRRKKDIYTQDIALRGFKNNYLKRYSAMPLRQFLVNPSAEVNNSLDVSVSTLQKNARSVNLTFTVTDTVSKQILYNIRGNNEIITTPNPPIKNNPVPLFNNFKGKQASLKFTQRIIYENSGVIIVPDSTNNIPEALLLSNDSVSIYTPLLDYYAYDDGTAETGADTDQSLGKVAIKFILSRADTINAVRFNFTPYFKDISGQFFLLQILESTNGKPGKPLHQQSVKVKYPNDINGFVEYPLDQNIAVKDTFFVAWTKVNEDVIGIGVDKNSPQFADKIYYNKGSDWIQNTTLKGSLMVRPVMGFKSTNGQINAPLGNETTFENAFSIYPNPTSDVVKWDFPNIKSVSIFDISGRELFYKETTDNQELNLKSLPPNTYLLKFSDGKKNFIRKIVVLH